MSPNPRSLLIAPLFLLLFAAPVRAQSEPGGSAPPSQGGCVAVMPAAVSGVDGNATEASTGLRDALVTFLSGPALQPVAVDARVRLQALEEARQKACSHFITLTLTKKAGGRSGVGRVVGQAAGTAAWRLPGGGSLGTAVARELSIGAVHALSNMAASTRSRDEMRLEWTLAPIGGSGRPTSRIETVKATADGEDLLTPLMQRTADAIVELLMKK